MSNCENITPDISSFFSLEGLYLVLEDGTRVDCTRENIEKLTELYWNDPDKIPEHVRQAVDFQRCPFCPLKNQHDLCDALRPILPLLDIFQKYPSYTPVKAFFRDQDKSILYSSETTLHTAMKYVTVLSLIQYCQIGRLFRQYYVNIIPIISTEKFAVMLYLNIFWIHRGDTDKIKDVIQTLRNKIKITSKNQVNRLNLISNGDSLKNAFVNAHIATELLNFDIDKTIDKLYLPQPDITNSI